VAEFEREIIRERTNAGLKAARARGHIGDRPALLNPKQVKKLVDHYKKAELSVNKICKLFNITKPTLYRYLRNNP
jgi:DNA invertase Pin-like site-specific DNA recombinase